jgi:hypothetical protein
VKIVEEKNISEKSQKQHADIPDKESKKQPQHYDHQRQLFVVEILFDSLMVTISTLGKNS